MTRYFIRVFLLPCCCLPRSGFTDHTMKATKHTEVLDAGRGQTEIRRKQVFAFGGGNHYWQATRLQEKVIFQNGAVLLIAGKEMVQIHGHLGSLLSQGLPLQTSARCLQRLPTVLLSGSFGTARASPVSKQISAKRSRSAWSR